MTIFSLAQPCEFRGSSATWITTNVRSEIKILSFPPMVVFARSKNLRDR